VGAGPPRAGGARVGRRLRGGGVLPGAGGQGEGRRPLVRRDGGRRGRRELPGRLRRPDSPTAGFTARSPAGPVLHGAPGGSRRRGGGPPRAGGPGGASAAVALLPPRPRLGLPAPGPVRMSA